MVLQQNARVTAAALLPSLSHLPPSMVIPAKKTVQKIINGDAELEQVQGQKMGEE